jgi:hypothetical protein
LLEASSLEVGPSSEIPVEWVTKPRLLEILEELSEHFSHDSIRVLNVRVVPGREPYLEVTGEVARASLDTYTQALEQLKAHSDVLQEPVGFLKSVGDKMEFQIKSPY